jgi:hypothetical protein
LTIGKIYPFGKSYLFMAESSYDLRRPTMKTIMRHALCSLFTTLLLAGMWHAGFGTGTRGLPGHMHAGVFLLLGMAILFAALFRRVRSEDRSAGLEAALCREQSARTRSDQAFAEADLLLARTAARASGDCAGDPEGQLVIIQAELTQIQQRCGADQATRGRLERLRTRLDRLAASLRGKARAVEPG